jgi:hypothetical protein
MYTSATVFDRPQHFYFVHDAIVSFDTNKVGYPRFWLFHGFPCYSHLVRIAGLNWDRISRERRFHPYRDVTSRETHTSSTNSTNIIGYSSELHLLLPGQLQHRPTTSWSFRLVLSPVRPCTLRYRALRMVTEKGLTFKTRNDNRWSTNDDEELP